MEQPDDLTSIGVVGGETAEAQQPDHGRPNPLLDPRQLVRLLTPSGR